MASIGRSSLGCYEKFISSTILSLKPKKVIMSGPSGFLGSRVFKFILDIHDLRISNGLPPGELILLSSSPGTLMHRLYQQHGATRMKSVRASRVDYYSQHSAKVWRDHMGSLGLEGPDCTFVNLAGISGPNTDKPSAMMDVNYSAAVAASEACQMLSFGHFIQSSSQATNAERAGQVPYSRFKAMADFALSKYTDLPVTIASLGLLYCKTDGIVGQTRKSGNINLIDLSLLPLTPVLGDGSAPLQPQEIDDAAVRIAYLALCEVASRPIQVAMKCSEDVCFIPISFRGLPQSFRLYDAVGPETMTMLDLLRKFAVIQGNTSFRPVCIGYRYAVNLKTLFPSLTLRLI
jgi:nucleoside-diphosphate-sugar epimerase